MFVLSYVACLGCSTNLLLNKYNGTRNHFHFTEVWQYLAMHTRAIISHRGVTEIIVPFLAYLHSE